MAVDPNGTIKSNDLGHAFDNGVMALASADVKIKPFGLPGHQSLTLSWSNEDRTSLIQDPSNIGRLLLTARFPRLGDPGPILTEILAAKAPGLLVPTQPLNQENDNWAAVYGFEQYLWQPTGDPKRGIAACASCHGPGGYRIGAPALTKQNELYLDQQLHAFAQGTRTNDMNKPMRTIAAMLTDSEMRALSHAYADDNTKQP